MYELDVSVFSKDTDSIIHFCGISRLYLDWLLNSTIREKFRAFYLGFHSVCASNALIMLRPEEVEQLVCGCQTFELAELRKVTVYEGYKPEDITIRHFWEVSYDCYDQSVNSSIDQQITDNYN